MQHPNLVLQQLYKTLAHDATWRGRRGELTQWRCPRQQIATPDMVEAAVKQMAAPDEVEVPRCGGVSRGRPT
jgi:hypothetical protein